MSTSEPTLPRSSSLPNAVDIVIAPSAAFARIRAFPAWGWVFLIASVLGIAGSLLAQPATLHAFGVSAPALYAPAVAKMPPDQQSAALSRMIGFGSVMVRLGFIFIPLVFLFGALISAVVMLIVNAVSSGDGTFKRFFALSMTTAVISGLGLLLGGLITLVRGPDNYETMQSVQLGLPSLALLAPGAGAKLTTFLGTLNVITIWATALTALGMVAVARIKPTIAWIAAALMLLCSAGITAAFVP